MRSFVRSNLKVVVAVLLTAAMFGGGPSVARMVFDATNADRVDGLHAKKFNKKAKKRKNKLIATNKKGFLPNNIIKVAPNAKKLAGIGPTGFWRKSEGVNATTLGGLAANAFALAAHDHDADYAALGHDHDAAEIISGLIDNARLDGAIARDAEVFSLVLANDGGTSGLDAQFLDGLSSSDFADANHDHSAGEIVSGTFDDGLLGAAIARDAEVFGLVLAGDGQGSGLDADFLDGISSGAFALDTDLENHYTETEADAAFVEDAGDVLVTAAPGTWQTPLTPVAFGTALDPAITYSATGITFSKTAAGLQTFSLYPTLPAAVYGKRLTFKGVELCYDSTGPGVTINSATATVVSLDGAAAPTPQPFALDATGATRNCVYNEFTSPAMMDADKGVSVQVVANWTTPAAPLVLGRVTFVFSPTDQDATQPSN